MDYALIWYIWICDGVGGVSVTTKSLTFRTMKACEEAKEKLISNNKSDRVHIEAICVSLELYGEQHA